MEWSRRAVIGAASALGVVRPAWAQAAPEGPPKPVAPSEPPPLDPLVLEILSRPVTRMSVALEIAGAPAQFVVDTGAERSAVATELAETLGLEAGPSMLVHGVTSPQLIASVRVPLIEVAGEPFRDLVLPVAPRARIGADGLLGLDILGQFRLTIDNRAQTITLATRAQGVMTGGSGFRTGSRLRRETTLEVRQRDGQLTLIGVSADGVPVEAFIDSGAQYSVGNPALLRSLAVRRPGIRDRRYDVPVLGVTGQRMIGELALIETLRVGPTVLHDMPTVFADLHAFEVLGLTEQPALLLGADLIGAFNEVVLDFVGGEVRFGSLRRRPETAPGI